MGRATWERLLDAGLVPELHSWFTLDEETLATVKGIGARSAKRMAERFAGAQQKPFGNWLNAMSAPPRGSTASGSHWAQLAARDAQAWANENGIGSGRARQPVAFFQDPPARQMATALHRLGVDSFVEGFELTPDIRSNGAELS